MDTMKNNNRDKYFKGQQDNERYICFFRHHWIYLKKEFLVFGIFIAITVVAILEIGLIKEALRGNRELKLFFLTASIIGTVYFHRFFLNLLNYFVNVGIITNIRIIDHHKSLFFTDNIDSIDMSQIQNIELKGQGFWPSLLNYGDISVFLAASKTVKTFREVPNAKFHFRCINRQKEDRQRGLYREHSALNAANESLLKETPETPEKPPFISTQ